MPVDLRDGIWDASDHRRDPVKPPELKAAAMREKQDEHAAKAVRIRAELGTQRSRAYRDAAAHAQATGSGFAPSFVAQSRSAAEGAVAEAASGVDPLDDGGLEALRAGLEADTDDYISRVSLLDTAARQDGRRRGLLETLRIIRAGVETDPDDLPRARERTMATLAVLAPMLPPEEFAPTRDETLRALDEAAIRGLIEGAPRRALAALDDPALFPDLPPDRRAALRDAAERRAAALARDAEADAESAATDDVHRGAADARRFVAAYEARIADGTATERELEEAVDRGAIAPSAAARLRARRNAEAGRRARRRDGVARVQARLNEGLPLDAADAQDAAAVEAYWRDVALPDFRKLPPDGRPAYLAALARDVGFVPDGAARTLRALWETGDPAQRASVAEIIRRLEAAADEEGEPSFDLSALRAAFTPRDRALQVTALELIEAGLDPAAAFERAEVIVRPPDATSGGGGGETLIGGGAGADTDRLRENPPTLDTVQDQAAGEPDDAVATADGREAELAPTKESEERAQGGSNSEADRSSDSPSTFLWRDERMSDARRRTNDRLFEDILKAKRKDRPDLERRIRRQFGDNSKMTRRIIQNLSDLTDTTETIFGGRPRRVLEELRSRNAQRVELSDQRIAEREAFHSFEIETAYQLRPASEFKVFLSRKDGKGRSIQIARGAARFLANDVPPDDPVLGIFLKLLSGSENPEQLRKNAKRVLSLPDPMKMKGVEFEIWIAQTAGKIVIGDRYEAFLGAQAAIEHNLNPETVGALLIPALFPNAPENIEALKETVLDLLPVIGEIRSLASAVKHFRLMLDAHERGQTEAARRHALNAAIDAIGGLAILGSFLRPAKRVARKVATKTPIVRVGDSSIRLTQYGRQAETRLPPASPKEAFGPLWAHFPESLQKTFAAKWSNMLGKAGEAEITRVLRHVGANDLRTVRAEGVADVTVNLPNLAQGSQQFDHVFQGGLIRHFRLFTRVVQDGVNTAIEAKLGSSWPSAQQWEAIAEIRHANGQAFATNAADGLSVQDAVLLRVDFRQLTPRQLEALVRETYGGLFESPEILEQAVKNIERFRRKRAKETITLGQVMTAVTIGVAVRGTLQEYSTEPTVSNTPTP